MKTLRLFALLIFPLWLQAQSTLVLDTTLNTNSSLIINVNSTWGRNNARLLHADYFPFNGPDYANFCSAYFPFKEPLQAFRITNNQNQTLHNLNFRFNHLFGYCADSLLHYLIQPFATGKANALSLYNYVANNHLYYYAPEAANPIPENYNAQKFLNVYGYGHCGMIATGLSQLAQKYTGQDQRFWYIDNGSHGLSEIKLDSTYVCLDADQEGFYLLPDNTTLATFQDIYFDKYLYLRTKHFGKAAPFNWEWNRHFNDIISNGFHFINHTDSNFNIIEPCCNRINTRLGEDVQITLPANTSISFQPQDTTFLNHFTQNLPAPDMTTVLPTIGHGVISTDYKPFANSISTAFTSYSNIEIPAGDTVYSAIQSGLSSSLCFQQSSPFVLHNGNVQISFTKQSASDTINIYFSKDSTNWIPLLSDATVLPGNHDYSLELLNTILPNSSSATYQCFFKVVFNSTSSTNGIIIRKLKSQVDFQYNKLTGPGLQNGANTIALYSSDTSQVTSYIQWAQSVTNHAPTVNSAPIFPQNNSLVDSNYFTFRWTAATDPDGDSIRDYQIMVGETPDVTYPIAGLFDRGLFLTNGGKPYFKPEISDYLSPNRIYYWKVRAQDHHGLWGDWSPVWSFSVHGPTYPKNLHWEFAPNQITDILQLVWTPNPSGDSAHYYSIYSSNDRNGFYPADSNLKATALNEHYLIHLKNAKAKHRVVAVDANGNKSSASYMVNLPLLITGTVGLPFDYIQSVLAHIQLVYEPWPTVNVNDRPLFCLVDTAKLQQTGTQLLPIDTGYTRADICTLIGNDTVYVFQLFVRIRPVGSTANYHEAPGLLVYPRDTIVSAQNNLIINSLQYDGFIDGDTTADLTTPATVVHSIDVNSGFGLYSSHALGASSTKYKILHQDGVIWVANGLTIQDSNEKEKAFIVIPNPFRESFTIKFKDQLSAYQPFTIQLINVNGNIVHQTQEYPSGETIHVPNLPKGIYLLRVAKENGEYVGQTSVLKI